MENDFLDKVEDNVIVRIWSEGTQLEKGDSLALGSTSELWDYTRVSVTQNNLQELKEMWDQWNDEMKQLFYFNYGDLPYLLDIKVDEQLFRALAQYWNPTYSCFTFGKVDLVLTVEEYTALLCFPRFQVDKAYSRASYVLTFWKKLMNITGMSEQWIMARIKQKDGKKKVDVFALSIYGLVIFPRALGYVDEAVSDIFDRLDKGVTPVPAVLAETISYRIFSETYSPLKELVATRRRDNISEENWIALLQNQQEENVESVGFAPLLVLRQYSSRQFVPATHGLAQCEFSYRGDNYKKKVKEISQAWNQARRTKRLAVGSMTTAEYSE
ncbi:hypothetical protein Gotri_025918 [Gossypium trilobum]|uniref:DUF7745 domain-containing protein n=1 Tax=Gossypium trilobum TaxID=34281 RepID=A0A7J9FJ08_9ROSI|nr:hypothetical protein [Gossypium trilobum]